MSYSATIQVQEPENGPELFRGRAYYRLRFECTTTTGGLPPQIFVHQQTSVPVAGNGGVGVHNDFINVAGPLDLTNIPADTPDAQGYLRLSTADLLIETVNLSKQTVDAIKQSVLELVNGLIDLDDLETTDEFTIVSKDPQTTTTTTTTTTAAP